MIKFIKKIKKKFTVQKGSFSCSICESKEVKILPLGEKYLRSFNKYNFVHSIFLFETLNIFNYSCQKCGGSDRSRLIALFLNKYFSNNEVKKDISLLDIAPTEHLQSFFKKYIKPENYRTADLFMEGVDDKVDLQDMRIYRDNSWDIIVCSHVLEHVKDDRKAISEIFRVLNKNGIAILMAPILLEMEESCEAEKNRSYTEAERWKYFGQDDHERLYSKNDFISRIEKAGFVVDKLGVDFFGVNTFKEFGITNTSVLYVARKV